MSGLDGSSEGLPTPASTPTEAIQTPKPPRWNLGENRLAHWLRDRAPQPSKPNPEGEEKLRAERARMMNNPIGREK